MDGEVRAHSRSWYALTEETKKSAAQSGGGSSGAKAGEVEEEFHGA